MAKTCATRAAQAHPAKQGTQEDAGNAARQGVAPRVARGACALLAAASLVVGGCKDKKKEEPINVPPPQGAASSDELSTAIGQARALSSSLAPTSTRWGRAFVVDDKRAILTGELETEAVALITDNAGRTWRSLRRAREGWSTWAVDENGALVLAMGPKPAQPSRDARVGAGPGAAGEPPALAFALPDAPELSASSPVALPAIGRGARPPVELVPGLVSAESAAIVVEQAPRRSTVVYAGPPGSAAVSPVALPPQERVLPVPYGRPPVLLSTLGRDLVTRRIPAPGAPLDPPQRVTGLAMIPAAVAALSAPPACELGGWSIQLVPQPQDRTAVVAVSAAKTTYSVLPAKAAPDATVGCGADRFTVEVASPKGGDPMIAVCKLDGGCTLSESPPFRAWPEAHERSIASAPTRDGVVAVLTSRSSERWGLYVVQSSDGGKIYEVPRVIGEGTGDRGRIALGALLSLGNRLVALLQADVTGTSRRGYYVTVSEDGGLTWNPP